MPTTIRRLDPTGRPCPLPIDSLIPEVVATVRRARRLVLEAPPGAGKTTRLPRALLDAGLLDGGDVIVLEPRRLAARLAARRVADELGEPLGCRVGYQTRFDEAISADTRIRFVTEGVLTRRLLRDPTLRGTSVVVLDELHERHLTGDVALALLRRLQRTERPDLGIVAMSATLASGPVAAFLEAPTLRADSRPFPVEIVHAERRDERPLAARVAWAVDRLVREGLEGDILVFLPGASEIRRAMEACDALARDADLEVLALHGALSAADQDRVVARAERRKVILATNVAESSVTIDGVVAVVDSGLARVGACSPWTGLPTVHVGKVARASAVQRAGRAGRTRPGRCLRLYTQADYTARPEHEVPEIARADLTGVVLELAAAGIAEPESLPWLDPPPPASLAASRRLLGRLGALADGALTPIGRRMLDFPVHPRLARVVVEGELRGVGGRACRVAALLGERDLRLTTATDLARSRAGSADLFAQLAIFEAAEASGASRETLRRLGLDPTRTTTALNVARRLAAIARRGGSGRHLGDSTDEVLATCVLVGFADRVGRLRRPGAATGRSGLEVVLAQGGTAVLVDDTPWSCELVVAVDVEDRREGHPGSPGAGALRPIVRLASAVSEEALVDALIGAIDDTTAVTWNTSAERVDVVRTLSYDGLVLEQTRGARADPTACTEVLRAAALAVGPEAFTDDSFATFAVRAGFLRRHCPELELPSLDDACLRAALSSLCEGRTSFAELRDADLSGRMRALLSPEQRRALAEEAPETIALAGGRRVRVDYGGEVPSAKSRLQDFFGMSEGPRVARGRVTVVLHLLAPNQRAVQITTDLAGFWSRHYPVLARELRRRYPKHPFPDDPLRASPVRTR